MKHGTLVICFATVLACVVVFAREPRPGDSEADVIELLGEPRGWIRTRSSSLLYYERGDVQLTNGVVVRVSLMSEEEAERIIRARNEAEERRQNEQRLRIARQQQEGEQLLRETRSDPLFARLSAAERVAFWRDFRRFYPMIDISDVYQHALDALAADRAREEQQVRIERLEERIAATERRALEAEARTRQRQNTGIYFGSRYTLPWGVSTGTRVPLSSPSYRHSRQPVIIPNANAGAPVLWQHDYFNTSPRLGDTHVIPRH